MVKLPPPDTKRWVAQRKAAVVLAIRDGLITVEEACRRYDLTLDELSNWQKAYRLHGAKGLQLKARRNKTP